MLRAVGEAEGDHPDRTFYGQASYYAAIGASPPPGDDPAFGLLPDGTSWADMNAAFVGLRPDHLDMRTWTGGDMSGLCQACINWAGDFATALRDGHHRECPDHPVRVLAERDSLRARCERAEAGEREMAGLAVAQMEDRIRLEAENAELRAELESLRAMLRGLCERVYRQSELLSGRAERS
jgi:hypothetical protein